MKQPSIDKKKHRSIPTPTQQDYEQDRFYYNNDEDTREYYPVVQSPTEVAFVEVGGESKVYNITATK